MGYWWILPLLITIGSFLGCRFYVKQMGGTWDTGFGAYFNSLAYSALFLMPSCLSWLIYFIVWACITWLGD